MQRIRKLLRRWIRPVRDGLSRRSPFFAQASVGRRRQRWPNCSLLLWLCVLVWPLSSSAEVSIDTAVIEDVIALGDLAEVFADSSGELGPEAVLALPQERWQTHPESVLRFGHSSAAWWVRLALHNSSQQPQDLVLTVGLPRLDHVDFALIGDTGILARYETGDQRPFAQRPLNTRAPAVLLVLAGGQSRQVLIRLASEDGIYAPQPIQLWTHAAFERHLQADNLVWGAYYGLLLALFVYHLIFFYTSRDWTFVYYSLYLAAFGLWSLGFLSGFGFQWLWPERPGWNPPFDILLPALAHLPATAFVTRYLQTRRQMPRCHWGLIALTLAVQVPALALVLAAPVPSISTTLIALASNAFVILNAGLLLGYLLTGLLAWQQGFRPARFFVLAWTFPFLGGLVHHLVRLPDGLPVTLVTTNSIVIGSTLQFLFLALALSERLRDADARVRASELRLQSANAEQRATLDAATVGIAFAKKRIIQRCNRTFEQLFGYAPGELIGRSTRCLYADSSAFEAVGTRFRRGIEQEGGYIEEVELTRKDKSRCWIRLSTAPIDPEDLSKGLVGTFQDVTAEREAMAQLHALNTELEQKVRDRTRQLTQALERAELALAREERAREEQRLFLQTVSHELRTPVSVIDLTAQNLVFDAEEADAQTRTRYEKILQATQRLSTLLDGALADERFSLIHEAAQRVPCDLRALLEDAAAAARLLSAGHDIRLRLDDLPRQVDCDPQLTGLALRNLTDNAVKYTPPGSRVLLHAWHAGRRGSDPICIEVADDGDGLAPDELAALFEPRFRGRNAGDQPGMGMGLPLTRRMIEAQGGTVTADCAPARGCRFRIWLPGTCASGDAPDVPQRELDPDLTPQQLDQ
ncbi:7TM diverse intracellular signaling domain-containing protein [Thiohalocapsa marina]|nr:7TM diverse intracellular signaling domain-containing protein [Thiohalocapsa marina]